MAFLGATLAIGGLIVVLFYIRVMVKRKSTVEKRNVCSRNILNYRQINGGSGSGYRVWVVGCGPSGWLPLSSQNLDTDNLGFIRRDLANPSSIIQLKISPFMYGGAGMSCRRGFRSGSSGHLLFLQLSLSCSLITMKLSADVAGGAVVPPSQQYLLSSLEPSQN